MFEGEGVREEKKEMKDAHTAKKKMRITPSGVVLYGVSWIVRTPAGGEILGIVLGGMLIFIGGRSVVQASAALRSLGSRTSKDDK